MLHPYSNLSPLDTSHPYRHDDDSSWLEIDSPEASLSETPPRRPLPHPPSPAPTSSSHSQSQIQLRSPTSSSNLGHFVKHSSKVTVLLSRQESGVQIPIYKTGETIDGILVVPRPSGLLSLDVKVGGTIAVTEVGEGRDFHNLILDETLFSWTSAKSGPFPPKVHFRYKLPTHYRGARSGQRFRLPPTYETHLKGIPGFRVEISYAVIVNIKRSREKLEFWRKSSREQLRVPFGYREISRPILLGPFPRSPVETPESPQTVFTFTLHSLSDKYAHVDIHLYLPTSQTLSMKEPIPFSITFFADKDILEAFERYQTPPKSFHPLSGTSYSSVPALQQQIVQRIRGHEPPINIWLQRRTSIDVPVPVTTSATDHIFAVKTIAEGVTYDSKQAPHSMTWSGQIIIPEISTGCFTAHGVQVADHIVLSIIPPEPVKSCFRELTGKVSVELTTESNECSSPTSSSIEWQ